MKLSFLSIGTAVLSLPLLFGSCSADKQAQEPALTKSGLNPENFVSTVNGKSTALYTLTNQLGMEVCVTNFGGRIVSIMVPGKDGECRDVVLGFDNINDYVNIPSDFGASIGRYANRIGNAQFVLDGDTIKLPVNNYQHCLHGGPTGWQYQVYTAEQTAPNVLRLDIVSPDGDNNFPGEVKATVVYTLTEDNAIDIAYQATTDKPTVVNMTNHSYFNLSGDASQTILNDSLWINSTSMTPVDTSFMTTGEIAAIAPGSPFDFTTTKTIGKDIEADDEQVKNGLGFDHNWVLDTKGDITVPAVVLSNATTGIRLTVYTDEPGIQVYTGNFLDGTAKGKKDIVYQQRTGICLETQKYPDTPNKPEWPSATLRPGETYTSHCIFKFDTL